MSTYTWHRTHMIDENGDGIFTEVMLDGTHGIGTYPGPAYNKLEWETGTRAAYEVQEDGSWTFQGQPFAGRVLKAEDYEAHSGYGYTASSNYTHQGCRS